MNCKNKIEKEKVVSLCENAILAIKKHNDEKDKKTIEKYRGIKVGFIFRYEIQTEEELYDYVFEQCDEDGWTREWRSTRAHELMSRLGRMIEKTKLTTGDHYFPSDEDLTDLSYTSEWIKNEL